VPPDAIDQGLTELSDRFFIQPVGSLYEFRHALIGDAVYASLPPHRRRSLHARVAAASAAAGFSDAFVSDQYERAHQPGPAFRHALAAAAEAAAMSAHREAVGLYRRAQRTAPTAALAAGQGDATALLDIDVTMGAVCVMAGRMEPTVLHVLGYLAMGRGDWADALVHLDDAYRLGKEMKELQRLSPALWGLAETALLQGRVDEAVDRCEEGYEASAAIEDGAYLFPYVLTGTRAYLKRGEPTNARGWLDRTERLILLRGIPGTLPALDHARGLLHLAEGHTGKAREALTLASTAWAERCRAWEGIQALLDLATCAVRSRRPAEAAALRARAHEQASAARMLALISLEAVSAGPPSPLTAREVEVARLIATGATNREIAAALFIAPKTVSAHVEHILTKLGAGRRAEIAAWAAAHPPAS
jgi:DNA-binding CsgD family transcriptional regulator